VAALGLSGRGVPVTSYASTRQGEIEGENLMAAELRDLYTDPLRARAAEQAAALSELVKDCRREGRPVPASVLTAVDALWRWAAFELTPRPRRSGCGRLSGAYADTPLPLELSEPDG